MKYGLSDKQLKEIVDIISSYPEIEEAILFGSRAIDTYKEASDVDIAIKGKKVNWSLATKLKDHLEEETYLPFFFDFVAYPTITNKELKKHINTKGKVLVSKKMNGWRGIKLGEVIKSNQQSVDKNYPYQIILYLDTGSITKGKIDSFQKYNISEAPSRAKRLVKNNDIIYSTVRPIQRHYGFIKNPQENLVVSTGFSVVEINQSKAFPLFIYHLLASDIIVEKLDVIAEGATSTYPSLKPSNIENLEILLPSLPEQKAIAEVLSSLDDKIDLLHRQNKTLETMAQTLFRKWFVENADEKWEEKALSYFGNIICGKTPSKKVHEYFDGKIPFIKIPDMHNKTFVFDTIDTLTENGKKSQNNKTLPEKSICVSCIATVGLVSMNAFESQTNQQINSIVPRKKEYRYYIYLFMKMSNDLLKAMASGGTATMNLNTSNFAKIPVIKPDERKMIEFHKMTSPLFEKIFFNQTQIRTLENQRDTLLPKLMSGAISIINNN